MTVERAWPPLFSSSDRSKGRGIHRPDAFCRCVEILPTFLFLKCRDLRIERICFRLFRMQDHLPRNPKRSRLASQTRQAVLRNRKFACMEGSLDWSSQFRRESP